MGRAPCCDKENVKKGPWSPEEDAKLKEYIEKHGTGGNWIALPLKVGLKRCGKSCRLRWLNYLRPNIKHGEFSDSEDRIICSLFASIGSRWSIIAAQLPGRTDNDIKNYWNTKLKKKLQGLSSSSLNHNKRRLNQIQATTFSTLPNYKASVLQNSSMESSAFECGINAYYTNPFKGIPRAAGYEPTFSFSTPVFMGSSCSTSSDGSCITNQISQESDQYGFSSTGENLSFQSCFGNGVLSDNNKFLIGSTDIAVDEKATTNGCFSSENSVMDYSIEEIKQLISTTSMYNNLNFFVDEIKTEE